MLAERGFRVIRFDNRDIGHSTKFERAGVPGSATIFVGRRPTAPTCCPTWPPTRSG